MQKLTEVILIVGTTLLLSLPQILGQENSHLQGPLQFLLLAKASTTQAPQDDKKEQSRQTLRFEEEGINLTCDTLKMNNGQFESTNARVQWREVPELTLNAKKLSSDMENFIVFTDVEWIMQMRSPTANSEKKVLGQKILLRSASARFDRKNKTLSFGKLIGEEPFFFQAKQGKLTILKELQLELEEVKSTAQVNSAYFQLGPTAIQDGSLQAKNIILRRSKDSNSYQGVLKDLQILYGQWTMTATKGSCIIDKQGKITHATLSGRARVISPQGEMLSDKISFRAK